MALTYLPMFGEANPIMIVLGKNNEKKVEASNNALSKSKSSNKST